MRILVLGDFHENVSGNLKKRISKEEFDFVIGVGDYTGIKEWRPFIIKRLNNSKKGISGPTLEEFYGRKGMKELLRKDEQVAKNVLRYLNSIANGKKGIFIFGNGDDDWYSYPFGDFLKAKKSRRRFVSGLKNIRDITYSKSKVKGVDFIGFGGYMDIDAYYDRKEFESDDEDYIERVERRKKSRLKLLSLLKGIGKNRIFVLHYPPKGIFDIIKDKKSNPMNGKSSGIGFFREAILKFRPSLVLCGHMHEYQGWKRLGKSIVINPGEASKGKYSIVEVDEVSGKVGKIKIVN